MTRQWALRLVVLAGSLASPHGRLGIYIGKALGGGAMVDAVVAPFPEKYDRKLCPSPTHV